MFGDLRLGVNRKLLADKLNDRNDGNIDNNFDLTPVLSKKV